MKFCVSELHSVSQILFLPCKQKLNLNLNKAGGRFFLENIKVFRERLKQAFADTLCINYSIRFLLFTFIESMCLNFFEIFKINTGHYLISSYHLMVGVIN